jgi:hypothetical protein
MLLERRSDTVLAIYSSNKSVYVSERMCVEHESDNCAQYSSNIRTCEYEYRNLCSYSSNTNTTEFCTGSCIHEYLFRILIMTLRYGVSFDRRGRTVPQPERLNRVPHNTCCCLHFCFTSEGYIYERTTHCTFCDE